MRSLISLIALVFIVACSNGEKEERQKLFDEVMEIHDEAMPAMGDLRKTKKQLEALADSLASDSTQAELAGKFKRIAEEIEGANESMMDWMRNFGPEIMEDGTPHGEVIHYLNEQKEAIDRVKKDMLESLKKGQEAID